MSLTVIQPFTSVSGRDYARGEAIEDAAEVAAILDSAQSAFVVTSAELGVIPIQTVDSDDSLGAAK